jgi:hypothetical protein
MTTTNFSRHAQAPRRLEGRPRFGRRLELRRQGGGHPMTLVTTLAVGALAGMMFAPAGGAAFASFETPANVVEGARTTPKTARLPRASFISPAAAGRESAQMPSACMPTRAAPARPGPIAYV